ncbi:MAG: 1-acyl-sn-glycerol-3-phosphate acyltransferase, partial [Prevotellaceae bacterium]|nr:1-acyl-sn-glycerol-3-phosphate acyltransferase [Prevotellaceae bacterium]
MESQFEDIRPYGIKELPDVLHRALREPQCEAVIKKFLPNVNIAEIEQQGLSVRTISDFQRLFILPVLRQLLQIKNAKLSHEGLEHVRFPALFISNHRDIIIDPAFLNFCLLDSNYNTTEIAVGNNLLVAEWVSILMRINKSFIVKRGLSSGEQLKAIKQLSAYIRYALLDKQESIWIAQREGRAKDASDLTQESVIKMLSLSGTGGLPDNLKELNIYPVSISYEYDPCDFLKVRELMQRRNNPQFRKTPEDDVLSMQTGVLGYTGRIHYAFTPALNPNLDVIAAATPDRKEQ